MANSTVLGDTDEAGGDVFCDDFTYVTGYICGRLSVCGHLLHLRSRATANTAATKLAVNATAKNAEWTYSSSRSFKFRS